MTVQELIRLLEDANPKSEVRLGFQPSWPLEYSIEGIVSSDEYSSEHECDEDCTSGEEGEECPYLLEEPDFPPEGVVWVVEDTQLGYAPEFIFRGRGKW